MTLHVYTEEDLPETGFIRSQLWTMWLRGMVDVTFHVEQPKSVDLIMFFLLLSLITISCEIGHAMIANIFF